MWSFVALLFSFYLKNLECVRVLELTFRSQPNEQCANGTSVREEQSLLPAFTLCTLTLLQLAGYVGGGAGTAAMKHRETGVGLRASLRW